MARKAMFQEKLTSSKSGTHFFWGGCNSVQHTLAVVGHLPLLPTRREMGFSAQEDLC